MIKNISKHLLIMIGAILSNFSEVSAQNTFQKTIGSTYQYMGLADVKQTSDSGYIVLGSTLTGVNGIFRSWLIKMDNSSQIVSQVELGNYLGLGAASIITLNDGGYLVCSNTIRTGEPEEDLGLTRVDANFNVMWSKAYGGYQYEFGSRVKQTSDGGFIACGLFSSSPNGIRSYLVKTDSAGTLQWARTFADTIQNYSMNDAVNIKQTNDNGYIICGRVKENSGPFSFDGYLIKTDSTGAMQWNKSYIYPEWNSFTDVTISGDGGYFLIGAVDLLNDSLTRRDISLTKVDSLGDVLWSKAYTRPNDDFGFSMINTPDNGLLLCGAIEMNNNYCSCAIIKTDSSGDIIWNKSYRNFINSSNSNKVIPTFDGGYLIGTTMYSGGTQLYLIKTDSLGNSNCTDSVPVFNTTNVTFTVQSPFITSFVDSNYTITPTSNPLTYTVNNLCFTGISDIDQPINSFTLFPNPVNSMLTVIFDNARSIKIYDLLGKVLVEKKISDKTVDQIDLDVASLSNGLYFISIDDAVQKFVKE